MDVAELVLRYVEAVIWPLVTLTVAWYLRSYLREAFARMTRIETPAGAIEFEAEARVLRERAEEVGEPISPEPYGVPRPRGTRRPRRFRMSGPPSRQQPPPPSRPAPAPSPAPEPFPLPEPPPGSAPADSERPPEPRPPSEPRPAGPLPRATPRDFEEAWELLGSSPVGALAAAWSALTDQLDAALPAPPHPFPGRDVRALRRRLVLTGAPPGTVTVFDGLHRLREAAVRDLTPVTARAARNYIAGCERLIESVAPTH
ncbi:hypothetical protein [Streptomyces sp. 891-h]|uniref:hypothetical protein n=1 Tax=Streptomyces sp. 891-h TaxID=2720714 RepID=UPI001FAA9681|nr:hypothetical protein [Streptomyces sp. 891-h]UNZ19944.1 hypothetical protein HC362_25760 [Streptomyces sp. 891-h]